MRRLPRPRESRHRSPLRVADGLSSGLVSARWRGRSDPGPVDAARMLPVGQGVFVALVVMALVLIWMNLAASL